MSMNVRRMNERGIPTEVHFIGTSIYGDMFGQLSAKSKVKVTVRGEGDGSR